MAAVASRDLRNHTAEVLRRVAAGESLRVTVHGEVVAELSPPADQRPTYLTPGQVTRITQADAGLRGLLGELDQATDNLGEP